MLWRFSKMVSRLLCVLDISADHCTASKISSRQRDTQIGPLIDEISEHAFQFGLRNDELQRVVNLVTLRTYLDQSSVTTLIKNLYPAERVPSDVIIDVVGALGQGKHKPSASSQSALVRWLNLVQDVLQDSNILNQLYGVLFDLLDMISLRIPLCQLLASITRRKHVRPFRIQRLLELCQQAGNEQALLGLLQVYKNFCPDIIIGAPVSSRALSLASSIEWRNRLLAIQSANSSLNNGSAQKHGGFQVARNGTRRVKTMLPEVHTFHPGEATVTLEEVQNVDDFVDNLERIEPPSQIIAGLRDPLLQKYLLLSTSTDGAQRLEFWLLRYFEEELETLKEGFGLSATLPEMLSALASHTEASKQLSPLVQKFLESYVPFWDGVSNLGLLLDILTYLSPQPFRILQKILLSSMERAILAGAHDPFSTLFNFYASLASRWLRQFVAEGQLILPDHEDTQRQAYVDLFRHVSKLAMSALASGDTASASIINFYQVIATTTRDIVKSGGRPVPIIVPTPQVVYLLTMSMSLSTLSGICSMLAGYKQAFEAEMRDSRRNPTESTRVFNGYLMDICNLIWRSRALIATDTNAMGCLYPAGNLKELQSYLSGVDQDYNTAIIFGPSHNPLTSSISKAAFLTLEMETRPHSDEPPLQHAGPVTQRSLVSWAQEAGIDLSWKDYRIATLDYLEARGANGVKDLMYATMKDLMR